MGTVAVGCSGTGAEESSKPAVRVLDSDDEGVPMTVFRAPGSVVVVPVPGVWAQASEESRTQGTTSR
ncbi:hypothetical protein [Myxococcus qinghaiensis]|uniref:hypothetical protein n=1 Tax=Myxococcus qinghaiensis TaxID=2906758 RepID=UPI0020A78797|nr:hypothetical protein [Myxococcus qinghaiensis]MCP3165357.1 hypothetical protein [Myxococcus qinghaiensis]